MNEALPQRDADRFLRMARAEQQGKLTVYLGAAPGVGKTYRMLQEAARRRAEGEDIVIGVAETHGRAETASLLAPFEILPRRPVEHQRHRLEEFDLDAALARRPSLVLVDELAHTNAPGSRHPKRWQDVAELLAEGIDVASTVNIQHIESLNDLVGGFTHIRVRETIPDSFLEDAELIVVDLPPEALIERLRAGKVYLPDTAGRALANFFTPNKLAALRELAEETNVTSVSVMAEAPDWFAYEQHFIRFGRMTFDAIIAEGEVGWTFLVLTLNAFGLGMTALTLVTAIIFCAGVFAIARSCQEPMLAIVASTPYLAIAVAMSGMRQAVAMGLVFLVLSAWYRWPLAVKVGVILLASTFHFSAIALLAVVVFESRLTLPQRVLIALFIGAVVVFAIAGADNRLEVYAKNYGAEGEAADAEGALYHVLLTAVPALAYFVMRNRWNELYGRIPVVDLFAGVGVAALFFVFLFPTATDRMTLYFAGVALIIQANFPTLWRGRTEQFLVRTAIIALNAVAMLTFLLAGNKAGSFVPYASIFSHEAQLDLPRQP